MTLFDLDGLTPPGPARRDIRPGAVHLRGWLTLEQQAHLADAYTQWRNGPVPPRAAIMPGGHRMSVETVCLGWHWQPYRYTRTADDVNGRRVRPLPGWLADLARRAVADAYGQSDAGRYRPDAALVNYYSTEARLGMHQDKDEMIDAPVVSFSVGDNCLFRFGNTANRGQPYTDVRLDSGDAFVFGAASRFAYHGVPKLFPATAPEGCGIVGGRLNITVRATGLPAG